MDSSQLHVFIDFGLTKWDPRAIFLRQNGFAHERPVNFQLGVIPKNGAFRFRGIISRRFVEKICGIAKNEEAMRESGRQPKKTLVLFREFDANPLAKRRRGAPEINAYVKHPAPHNTDQLSLRLTDLIVQTAKNVLARTGMV